MKQIQRELAKVTGEKLISDSPDIFKEAVQSLKRDVLLRSSRRFGTPQYFLDTGVLQQRAAFFAATMRRYIPRSDFFYAFKCNDLPLLAHTLKGQGYYADVAGIFELQLALKLGFKRIVFSGPGKSRDELICALKQKKRVVVNIDNFDELRLLISLAGAKKTGHKAGVGFRLCSETSAQGAWWKFGFKLEELSEAVRLLSQSENLQWTGLHFHCSWNKTPNKYLKNIHRIGTSLRQNFPAQELRRLRFFDIGGGFFPEGQAILHKGEDKGILLDMLGARRGNKEELYQALNFDPCAFSITPVQPLETFAREISGALNEFIFPLNPHISIYFEPGRFIATHATTILLGVVAVKKNAVIVDGGINMLGDYKFSECSFAPVVNISHPSMQLRRQMIFGSLCDPSDLWGYSYYGDELKKGDVLAVLQQGAYTFTTAWRFIKPVPAYIAASGKRLIVAKSAERFQDRYAGCRFERNK